MVIVSPLRYKLWTVLCVELPTENDCNRAR